MIPYSRALKVVSRSELSEDYLLEDVPILISDGLADWPAVQKWRPDNLGTLAPAAKVDVQVSLSGSFRVNPDRTHADLENHTTLRNVSFSQIAKEILNEEHSLAKFYVTQQSIRDRLPELIPDLHCWWPVEETMLNLWFGSAGVATPLHFDGPPNLFAQIYGQKRFTIFSPKDTPLLYPYPSDSKMSHVSYVDVENPDPVLHPKFAEANGISFVVSAGQMLFLPPRWWHHVKSITTSISVNQWLKKANAV